VPLVIAYEPVWAIGTGKVASVNEVSEAHVAVRKYLETTLSANIAAQTSILYGGSVKPDNAKELASVEDVDGFLVGGASLKPKDFFAIYSALKK
jgi:triosephosphate isomerase